MANWLPDRSVASVSAALAAACPDLAGTDVTLRPWTPDADPAWRRGSAFVDGGRLVVKFAWSAPAAGKLEREVSIHSAFAALPDRPPLPPLVAASADPILLVYRFVPGDPLTGEFVSRSSAADRDRLAGSLAGTLAAFHHPATLDTLSGAGVELGLPVPQATTDAIRDRLRPRLTADNSGRVARWCDWADRVLASPSEAVVLHGDFHGHNLVVAGSRVRAVLDVEEVAAGDRCYDFRYLPAQEAGLGLFHATAGHYQRLTGITVDTRRVLAWHVRTVLGDALWRTEAGVALPGSGTVSSWVAELAQRFDALRIDPAA